MSDKIKVPASQSKDSYLRFRTSDWKRRLLKQIADKRGTTMSAMFDAWLDQLIAGEEIEIEIDIDIDIDKK